MTKSPCPVTAASLCLILFALAVCGRADATREMPITLHLRVETQDYKVGSPIAGLIVLVNHGQERVEILSEVSPENGGLHVELTGPRRQAPVLYWNHPYANITRYFRHGPMIAPGDSARFPLYVVSECQGELALPVAGTYTMTGVVEITFSVGAAKERFTELTRSESVRLEVGAAELGFEQYRAWLASNDICFGLFARAISVRPPKREELSGMGAYEREVSVALTYSCGEYCFREWMRTGGRATAAGWRPDDHKGEIRELIIRGAQYSRVAGVGGEIWRKAARIFEAWTGEELKAIPEDMTKGDSGEVVLDEL